MSTKWKRGTLCLKYLTDEVHTLVYRNGDFGLPINYFINGVEQAIACEAFKVFQEI